MNHELHKRTTPRTAHFYSLGQLNSDTQVAWIALHGYGQLASNVISKFRDLDTSETCVIAPEGLSKFYWHDKNRSPVASWMTKEHRLDEIRDYLQWLDSIYDEIISNTHSNVIINILGFSQGCQTMWRWLGHRSPMNIKHIIHWAGGLPIELDLKSMSSYLETRKVEMVFGDQDKFVTSEIIDEMKTTMFKVGWTPDYRIFDGNHRLDRGVLMELLA